MGNFIFDVQADLAQVKRMQQTAKSLQQFQKAAGRALNRGLTTANTEGKRQIQKRYDIRQANVDKYSKVTLNKATIGADGIAGQIRFAGQKIPLYRYSPKPATRQYTTRFVNGHSGWRVTKDVSAADLKGDMKARPSAFIATFKSGHTGIFRRTAGTTSSGKSKLTEYWGFSVADMLDYEDAREAILEKTAETIDKRLAHEIEWILNGN